jgi:hypothetical protein
MRTSAECMATAAQLQEKAALCREPGPRESYQRLALQWRGLAHQATYQDSMEHRLNNTDPA